MFKGRNFLIYCSPQGYKEAEPLQHPLPPHFPLHPFIQRIHLAIQIHYDNWIAPNFGYIDIVGRKVLIGTPVKIAVNKDRRRLFADGEHVNY